jgi:hypothetical protein
VCFPVPVGFLFCQLSPCAIKANFVLNSLSFRAMNNFSAYSEAQQCIDIWLLVSSSKHKYEPDKIEPKIQNKRKQQVIAIHTLIDIFQSCSYRPLYTHCKGPIVLSFLLWPTLQHRVWTKIEMDWFVGEYYFVATGKLLTLQRYFRTRSESNHFNIIPQKDVCLFISSLT